MVREGKKKSKTVAMCFSFTLTEGLCFPSHLELLGRGSGWLAGIYIFSWDRSWKIDAKSKHSRVVADIPVRSILSSSTENRQECRWAAAAGSWSPDLVVSCQQYPQILLNIQAQLIRPTMFPAKQLGFRQAFCHKFPVTSTLGNKGSAHSTALISEEH